MEKEKVLESIAEGRPKRKRKFAFKSKTIQSFDRANSC